MLLVYCEGSTECEFVKRVLAPYLKKRGIVAKSTMCTTSKDGGQVHKGGVRKYSKIKAELRTICRDPHITVTTMIDLYGLPSDTPGYGPNADVASLENAISNDMSCENLVVNLMKHEFEALLFSDMSAFKDLYPKAYRGLMAVRDRYDTPEDINTSPNAAPSKRIIAEIPRYTKVYDGMVLSERIGIEAMMRECPHFRSWIEKIVDAERKAQHLSRSLDGWMRSDPIH